MKYLKMLGLAAVAAAALTAFMGANTASATTLTNGSTAMGVGAIIHSNLESGTVAKITTSFKNIECEESTLSMSIANAGGSGTEVSGSGVWTFNRCNCEVKTLAGGSFSIASSGGNTGAVTSRNAEITASCSTVFGPVHCIYATGAGTSLGTLNGGIGATLAIKENNLPRLATSAACAEKAHLDASYVVDVPATLNID